MRVLSNSWAGGGFSQALLDEITRVNQSDILFVAAPNEGVPGVYLVRLFAFLLILGAIAHKNRA